MDPSDGALIVVALDEDHRLEGRHGERNEGEGEVARRGGAGKKTRQVVLVGGGAVEPPLEVGREEEVDRLINVVVVVKGFI